MARYEHLSIYQEAYKLLVFFEKIHPDLPKKYKYTLGMEIRGVLFQIIKTMIRINNTEVSFRVKLFQELEEKLIDLQIYIRLFKDLGGFVKITDCETMLLSLESIRKQMSGWRK